MALTLIPQQQTKPAGPGILLAVLLFAICLFGPKLLVQASGITISSSLLFLLSRLMIWVCLGAIWLYAIKVERQSLLPAQQSLSIWKFLLATVLVLLATLLGSILVNTAVRYLHLAAHSAQVNKLTSLGIPLKLFTVVTAAITEELIFRGYLLSRLNQLFGKGAVPVLLSALLFGLVHAGYGTLTNILMPLVIGLIFGFFQQRYRNIYVLILCHFLIDFYALFLTA